MAKNYDEADNHDYKLLYILTDNLFHLLHNKDSLKLYEYLIKIHPEDKKELNNLLIKDRKLTWCVTAFDRHLAARSLCQCFEQASLSTNLLFI